MLDLGIVKPGGLLYIPFNTFDSNDPSASVTLTGLSTADVEIYKDGGTTQRASDAGFALLDTDGIDFDGITGIHGISIDLADNTTGGFYAAGSQYWVVISSVTIDAATVNFIAATFRIGYPNAILNTTIASLASQTSFTLTAGPAEDDALNGMWCVLHDVASGVQMGKALILDYTGSTKTVTLAAATTFTAAASDNFAVIDMAPLQPTTLGRTLDVSTGGEAGLDWANIGSPTTANNLSGTNIDTDQVVASVSGAVASVTGNVGGNVTGSVGSVAAGGIVAASFAADAITAAKLAADVTTELQTGLATASALSTMQGNVTDILADTADMQPKLGTPAGASISADLLTIDNLVDDLESRLGTPSDLGSGATVAANLVDIEGFADNLTGIETKIDTIDGIVDSILVDTAEIGAAGAGLTVLATQASVNTVDTVVDAIKLSTDNLPSDPADASVVAGLIGGLDTKIDTIDNFLDTEIAGLITSVTGIVPVSGTIGATGNSTTALHLAGLAYADDGINSMLLTIKDVSTGLFYSRWIEDFANTGDLATVATLPFTPEASVDQYWLTPVRSDVTGGSGLDAAGVRAAIGLASANLDTQLGTIDTEVGVIDGIVDAILVDTAEIGAAGAGLTALATQASVNTIDDFLDTEISAILADTNELQTDWANGGRLDLILDSAASAGDPWGTALPGAYGVGTAGKIVGDNINATISSRATQTSVDTIDGIVDDILTDTAEIGVAGAGLTNINLPNQTMDIVGNITGNLSGSVGSVTGAVGSVTGNVGGNVTGSVGSVATGGITAGSIAADAIGASELAADAVTEIQAGLATAASIAALNNLSAAQVNTEVDTALADYDAPTRAELTTDTNSILTAVGDVPTNAELATALGTADDATLAAIAALSIPTAAAVADAVWDEDATAHQTQGTFGQAIGDPVADSDTIWALVNTNLNATVSSRASQTSVDDLPTNAELATALSTADDAVLTAIDDLPTNAELATALGTADDAVLAAIAALNNLSQANVRTAIGLASANLDTQLDALPTNAELATALGTADDAVLAAVAALNNLSSAQAQTAAAAALTAYDPPTRAEAASDKDEVIVQINANETKIDTVDTVVDAIKAKTDSLTFTTAGNVDANITYVNSVEVTGDGESGTEWGPA